MKMEHHEILQLLEDVAVIAMLVITNLVYTDFEEALGYMLMTRYLDIWFSFMAFKYVSWAFETLTEAEPSNLTSALRVLCNRLNKCVVLWVLLSPLLSVLAKIYQELQELNDNYK